MQRSWENLPDFLRTEAVRPYYERLQGKRSSLFLKRCFDVLASSVLLVILSPVFFVLAIWIKCDSKGPVFFRQERITTYGKKFRIFKFRTMVQDAEQRGSLVTTDHDARITRVGEKLRRRRLDELPQLLNVWIGQMSFVGTRPEVAKYVARYTEEMYATLLLPGGITSEASIRFKDEDRMIREGVDDGRTADEVYVQDVLPQKMEYNLEAIRNFSLGREWKLLFRTLGAVHAE